MSKIKFGKNDIFGLYGAGGFAREVMPLVVQQLTAMSSGDIDIFRQVSFVETQPAKNIINGHRVLSEAEFLGQTTTKTYFNVAVADPASRERLFNQCMEKNANPLSLISMQSQSYEANDIGNGAILCANTLVTSNVRIGKLFHANIFSYVAHDCIIGDFVTFAPRVNCNGHVIIGDKAYIGTAAIIKEGSKEKPRVIGEGAIIGMGAVVTKDVAPYTTVVGNPAREI